MSLLQPTAYKRNSCCYSSIAGLKTVSYNQREEDNDYHAILEVARITNLVEVITT